MGNEKIIVGLYEPTEKEQYDCTINYKSCNFGICSECTLGNKVLREDFVDEE